MIPRPPTRADLRRAQVLGHIKAHPGCCFRELARATGLATGAASHYVRTLKKRGLVEEAPLGMRRLFFPVGQVVPDLAAWKMLREPGMADLRDWLAGQALPCQRDVLDHAAAAWSWPRATTQHRLDRLVRVGLVARIPIGGRRLVYRVRDGPPGQPFPQATRITLQAPAEVA